MAEATAGSAAGAAGTFSIYRRLLGARLRGDLQYRASFWLRTLSGLLITGLEFVVIVFIFDKVPRLQGWELMEVAFLYGAGGTAFNITNLFIGGIERLSVRIKEGSFDRYLIRPLGSLAQLAADEFALRRVGNLSQSLAVFLIALATLDVRWTPDRLAMLVVMLAAGIVIFSSIWVMVTAVAFWTVEAQELGSAFTYGGNFLSQFPISIYGEWLRRLLAFVVPIAFVAYFPALYILGRTSEADRLGLPSWVMFASPAVAALSWAVALFVWRQGLRHYRSTGS